MNIEDSYILIGGNLYLKDDIKCNITSYSGTFVEIDGLNYLSDEIVGKCKVVKPQLIAPCKPGQQFRVITRNRATYLFTIVPMVANDKEFLCALRSNFTRWGDAFEFGKTPLEVFSGSGSQILSVQYVGEFEDTTGTKSDE